MRTVLTSMIRIGVLVGLLGVGYAQAQTTKCDNMSGAEKERCMADAKK
jgi:hypothetical protein